MCRTATAITLGTSTTGGIGWKSDYVLVLNATDTASDLTGWVTIEYHLYTLDGRTTIKDNQTKQLALLSAADVPVDKRLIYRAPRANHPYADVPSQEPWAGNVIIAVTGAARYTRPRVGSLV